MIAEKILVGFHSRGDAARALADAIAEGAQASCADTRVCGVAAVAAALATVRRNEGAVA